MNEFKVAVKINAGKENLVDMKEFSFPENGILFLLGESGIGKTLVSKAIFGLLENSDLDVIVRQKKGNGVSNSDLRTLTHNGFFLFQEPSSHLNPLMTLEEQLNEGCLSDTDNNDKVLRRLWNKEAEGEGYEKLMKVFPKPYRPSGGEKQRFLGAMALKQIELFRVRRNNGSGLFVFDEPSGNLDNYYRDLMVDYILELYREKPFTIVFITHDYSLISRIRNNHALLADKVVFRELVKKNGLVLQEFEQVEYLKWIEAQRTKKRTVNNRRKSVLSLESGVEIFEMKLGFERNIAKKNTSALQLYKNTITYLKAPSGLGKTTIAKIIMGLQHSDKFNMSIDDFYFDETTGREYWKQNIWGKVAGLVFQHADEALNLNSSVYEVFSGLPLKETLEREKLKEFLHYNFDLNPTDSFLSKKVKYLSGGQKQRINLARTFLLDPDILILDEPVNGMDFNSIKSFVNLLEVKKKEGKAILLISHNEEIFDSIVHPRDIVTLKKF